MRYSRKALLELCELSLVPESRWANRDSANAQMQVGELQRLLKAGCSFRIMRDAGSLLDTDESTIWIEVYYIGFSYFDGSGRMESKVFYLPTQLRLDECGKYDWY